MAWCRWFNGLISLCGWPRVSWDIYGLATCVFWDVLMSAAGLRFPMCGVCRLPSLSRAFQITDVRKYPRYSSFRSSGSKHLFIICTKMVCQFAIHTKVCLVHYCLLFSPLYNFSLSFLFPWQLVLEAHNVPELSAGVNCTFEDLAEMDGLVEGNRITCSSPAEKEVPRIVVDQGVNICHH